MQKADTRFGKPITCINGLVQRLNETLNWESSWSVALFFSSSTLRCSATRRISSMSNCHINTHTQQLQSLVEYLLLLVYVQTDLFSIILRVRPEPWDLWNSFYRPDTLRITQPTVSKKHHWFSASKALISHHFITKSMEDVMARYSNLLPVGILRVIFQLVFVCTYIMLCLCRGAVPRR